MSTELVAILDRWTLNGPSARVNVKLGVLRDAADELTALIAKVADAEQRIAALMSERSSLIATKAEQLVALTKRATAAEAAVKKEQAAWMDIERANRELFDGAVEDILKIKDLTAKVALLTEALATDRLAVIEECARAADAVAKEIKAKGWPQYAAQQCATAIRAISESDKEKP